MPDSAPEERSAGPPAPERRSFGRALLAIFSGSAAVQLIGIGAAPITARIFEPAQAGLAGVVNGLVAVSAGVACLRYEQAIALAGDRRSALHVVTLCLLIAPTLCVAALVLLGLTLDQAAALIGDPAAKPLLLAAPLSVFLLAAFSAVSQLALRDGMYQAQARARVAQSTGQIGFQLGVGALTDGRAWVMVWGFILGNLISLRMLLARQAGFWRSLRRSWDRRALAAQASEFRRFPIYGSWAAFLDSFSGSLPLFAVVSAFGTAEAGFVRMAQTLVVLPIAALTSAVASVYWTESARSVRDDPARLLPLYRMVTRRLMLAGTALIAGSALLPWIVPVVLSERWAPSGSYAVILAFPAAASLVCSGAVNLALIGLNRLESAWIVARFLLLLLVAWGARRVTTDVRTFLLLLAVAQVAGYAALIWINDRAVRRFTRSVRTSLSGASPTE